MLDRIFDLQHIGPALRLIPSATHASHMHEVTDSFFPPLCNEQKCLFTVCTDEGIVNKLFLPSKSHLLRFDG